MRRLINLLLAAAGLLLGCLAMIAMAIWVSGSNERRKR